MKKFLFVITFLSINSYLIGQSGFGPDQIITTLTGSSWSVHAADLDQDGDNDVLTASYDGKVAWYENLGSGSFGVQQIIWSSAFTADDVFTADLDNDGDIDVLSVSNTEGSISWYENLGGTTFSGRHLLRISSQDGDRQVHSYDFDNDGDMDVVSAKSGITPSYGYYGGDPFGELTYFENLGGGMFASPTILFSGLLEQTDKIELADIDGDGNQDIIGTTYLGGKVFWLQNLGGSSFSSMQVISTLLASPYGVYGKDMDGDSDIDVVSASTLDNRIAWFENTGGGTFGTAHLVSDSFIQARDLYVADLDGDGDADVLCTQFAFGGTLSWFENLGSGSFGAAQEMTSSLTGPSDVFAADLDNDGDVDVLSTFQSENETVWFENLMGCNTTFPPQSPLASVGAADVELTWDTVGASVACQVKAKRIVPAGPNISVPIYGAEVTNFIIPFPALGLGTTWSWRVRCACQLTPVISATGYSLTGTFIVPILRHSKNIKPEQVASLKLTPTVATSIVTVHYELGASGKDGVVQVYDLMGAVINETELPQKSGQIKLNVSDWKEGVYVVSIFNDQEIILTKKMIKSAM